jgi:hypothetical protein
MMGSRSGRCAAVSRGFLVRACNVVTSPKVLHPVLHHDLDRAVSVISGARVLEAADSGVSTTRQPNRHFSPGQEKKAALRAINIVFKASLSFTEEQPDDNRV